MIVYLAPTALAQNGHGVARIAVLPTTVLVTNSSSHSVSFIDSITNTVVSTVPVGTNPGFPAVDVLADVAYVPNRTSDTVSVLDIASRAVIGTIPVANGPWTAAVTPDGTKVYVGCADGIVSVIDTQSQSSNVSIVLGAPAASYYVSGLEVAPDGSRVYALWGNLMIIDVATDTVTGSHFVGITPVTLDVTPDGSRVVTASAFGYSTFDFYGVVSIFDTQTLAVTAVRNIGAQPSRLVITREGRYAFISTPQNFVNVGTAQGFANVPWVQRLDLVTLALTSFSVGSPPRGIALSPLGETLYVATPTTGNVRRVSTATLSLIGSVTVGASPQGVAVHF